MYLASKRKWIMIGFILIYLIRLIIAQKMGLMPQDAYYYYYAENLSLSYFDHPAMLAYMLAGFTFLLGKSVVAIKITDFLLTAASFILFYYLSHYFLSKKQAVVASLFFGSSLLVTILSINTTPDVPLIFFWILTLVVLSRAVFEQKKWAWPLFR
jgi:4-amino-4-deoxy-L-arabinose transferase-like glycosyltransferase